MIYKGKICPFQNPQGKNIVICIKKISFKSFFQKINYIKIIKNIVNIWGTLIVQP